MSTIPQRGRVVAFVIAGVVALAALAGVALLALGASLPLASATGFGSGSPTVEQVAGDGDGDKGRVTTGKQVREVGNVLECTGTINGLDAYASLYENSYYGNTIQIVFGDDGLGNGRQVEGGFVDGTTVRGSVTIEGTQALVTGTASRTGERIPVTEGRDHAGEHLVVDGFQRTLIADLTLQYAATTVPLTCDDSFHYDLVVTKESITEK